MSKAKSKSNRTAQNEVGDPIAVLHDIVDTAGQDCGEGQPSSRACQSLPFQSFIQAGDVARGPYLVTRSFPFGSSYGPSLTTVPSRTTISKIT